MTPRWLHWPAATGGWLPSDLTALYAWYKADALSLANNDPVSTWHDSSGNGYHLTQRGSLAVPTYSSTGWNGSLPEVVFSGSNTPSLENTTQFTQASCTIAGVYKATTTNQASRAFGIRHDTTATGSYTFAAATDNTLRFDGSFAAGSITATTGSFVRVATRSTSARTDHIDGVSNVSSAATLPSVDGHVSLGSIVIDPSVYTFSGTVVEFVVLNAIISNSDREKLEGYLAHRWGLTANLPSTHPYKATAP